MLRTEDVFVLKVDVEQRVVVGYVQLEPVVLLQGGPDLSTIRFQGRFEQWIKLPLPMTNLMLN